MRWIKSSDIWRLLLSMGISALVLGLLFKMTQSTGEQALPMLRAAWLGMPLSLFLLYVLAQLVQGGARAIRYRLLLRGGALGKAPPWYPLVLVTFVRNMLVDMVPARLGELMYVGMLKAGCNIRSEAGLASMGVSILVDLVALAAVLFVAILTLAGPTGGAVPTLILIAVASLIGWVVVFYAPQPVVGLWRKWAGPAPKWRLHARALDFSTHLAEELTALRHGRALGAALAWSALIRAAKYGGLLALFYGVTHQLWPDLNAAPVSKLLIALIAAEGAAALPVPTFMAFGAYEAGGVGALTLLGADPAQATLAMLALHIASQAVDYTLGLLSWFLFMIYTRGSELLSSSAQRLSASRGLRIAVAGGVALVLILSLLLGVRHISRSRLPAATVATVHGESVEPSADADQLLRDILDGRTGFIVWSSNRYGQHSILRRRLPDGPVERLTTHDHTDTYPRISPCGKLVVFCRSQETVVSQRNPAPWDVYLLDLADGSEKLLAQHGFTPTWTDYGNAVVFVRGGSQVIHLNLETGVEQVIASAGSNGIPQDNVFQTPDYQSDAGLLAATLRGSLRATAILQADNPPQIVGGGCQLSWFPDRSQLYFVDNTRGRANIFKRVDPSDATSTAWYAPAPPYERAYFPRLSADEELLVYGAAASGHEHDQADYEIFIVRPSTPQSQPARLT